MKNLAHVFVEPGEGVVLTNFTQRAYGVRQFVSLSVCCGKVHTPTSIESSPFMDQRRNSYLQVPIKRTNTNLNPRKGYNMSY